MKIKKIISALLASTMLISTLPAFADGEANANAVSERKFSAAEVEVTKSRIDVTGGKNGLNICTQWTDNNKDTSDKTEYGRLYKLNKVFGLGENEYGLEMTAREQREKQPYMMYFPQIVYDLSESFYITYDVYVGDMRDNDFFRMGGQFYDANTSGNGRHMFFPYFRGTGVILNDPKEDGAKLIGAYVPNNWYKQTIAYDKTANTMTYYIDGKIWGSAVTVTPKDGTTVNNLTLGVRMDPSNEKTDGFGGAPSWFVLKEAEIKKGTYDAAKSNTTITSTDYTVNDKSIVQQANAKASDAVSSISSVTPNTTVSDFMSKITAPTGGSVSIVKIASDSGETQAVENTETVTSEMSVLAKSADGAMKLYNIELTEDTSLLPTLAVASDAPSVYTIDNDENVVTVCDAKLSTLKNRFTVSEGESIKFEKYDGTEITEDDTFVDNSMKLVAVKGDKEIKYTIQINNPTIFNPTGTIESLADGTVLFEASGAVTNEDTTYTGNVFNNVTVNYANTKWGNILNALMKSHYLPLQGFNINTNNGGGITLFGNGKTTEASAYKITKTTMNEKPAYNFQYTGFNDENGNTWLNAATSQVLHKSYPEKLPANMVVSFNVKATNNSHFYVGLGHHTANDKGVESGGKNGDAIFYRANKTGLYYQSMTNKNGTSTGGTQAKLNGAAVNEDSLINTEHSIALVESTTAVADSTDNPTKYTFTVDGIYYDKQKLDDSTYTFTMDHNSNYGSYTGKIRDLRVACNGDVTFADFKVYLVDDYNPNPTEGDKPEEVSLNLWSDSYENSVQISSTGKITGWQGLTIQDIKSQLNCNAKAVFKVRTADDMKEVTDNTLLEDNMLVVVSDPFYTDRKAYYYLAGDNEWDNYTVTEETVDEVTMITVKRNYTAYDKPEENIPTRMIFASYDADGNLANIQVLDKKINGAGDWDFSVTLPKTASTYKVFMWNSETQAPMEDVYDPTSSN